MVAAAHGGEFRQKGAQLYAAVHEPPAHLLRLVVQGGAPLVQLQGGKQVEVSDKAAALRHRRRTAPTSTNTSDLSTWNRCEAAANLSVYCGERTSNGQRPQHDTTRPRSALTACDAAANWACRFSARFCRDDTSESCATATAATTTENGGQSTHVGDTIETGQHSRG